MLVSSVPFICPIQRKSLEENEKNINTGIDLKGMKIKFSKTLTNSTRYAHVFTTFRNLDDGTALINTTVEFFQDVLKEMVKKTT